MNMAALWKLPVIYVCENNLYGEYTPCGETVGRRDPRARPRAFGIHAESVDGQDVQAVNPPCAGWSSARAAARARRSRVQDLPLLRAPRGRREPRVPTKDEEREWMTKHDPLLTLAGRLTAQRLADESVFERIQSDVKAEIDAGVQYALAAPYPEANEVDQDVYACTNDSEIHASALRHETRARAADCRSSAGFAGAIDSWGRLGGRPSRPPSMGVRGKRGRPGRLRVTNDSEIHTGAVWHGRGHRAADCRSSAGFAGAIDSWGRLGGGRRGTLR
jgi:hypothetical protein